MALSSSPLAKIFHLHIHREGRGFWEGKNPIKIIASTFFKLEEKKVKNHIIFRNFFCTHKKKKLSLISTSIPTILGLYNFFLIYINFSFCPSPSFFFTFPHWYFTSFSIVDGIKNTRILSIFWHFPLCLYFFAIISRNRSLSFIYVLLPTSEFLFMIVDLPLCVFLLALLPSNPIKVDL